MSRRNRLLIWLAGIITLMGLGYASLPWLLVSVTKSSLAAQGLHDIQLSVDYPHWRGIRLHELAFTAFSDGMQVRVKIPAAEIEYHLSGLVTGRVDRIRVPVTRIHIQPAPSGASSGQSTATLPLAVLISGQWLAQLPLRELSLDRLNATWQATTDTVYVLRLSAQLQNALLKLSGDISLPPLPNPVALSFNAGASGKADLNLSSEDNPATPLLAVAVTSVDTGQKPMKVTGKLHASLKSIAPLLTPWLKQIKQVSGIAGEIDSQWQARINDSTWQLTGEAKLHGLDGHWRELAMPANELTARFAADPNQATLHASLSTAEKAVVVQVDGLYQFARGRGHALFKLLPVEFAKSGFVLSHLLRSWPYPFDVNAGRASAAVQLQWDKLLSTKLDLRVDKLGGHYNKITFSGLSSKMTLTMNKGIATSKAAQVHVASLDIGFPVENITAKFALAPTTETALPVVRVHNFSASLLGGRAHGGPFALDFTRDRNAFEIQLEHIGLDQIMLLEQQEGLEGSGLLDGTIPISISREGIEVVNGQLAVRAPGGIIRYTPTPKVASLAQSNPSVKMVIEALSNFHYQVMDVQSDYKSSGDLAFQVHLEGKNPDWQKGQPLHLNLNLQENIPALLRSLQLSGEISERLRQRYQNKH